jgi:hypothetical protein
VHPTFGSAPNFAPPLFLLYLLALPALVALTPHGWIWLLPLGLYAVLVLIDAVTLAATGQVFEALGAIPLIVLTHVLYGFGFWRGLFTQLKPGGARGAAEVRLERIKTF